MMQDARHHWAMKRVRESDQFAPDFLRWLRLNWHIYLAFERRAYRAIKHGYRHLGSMAIINNIRWQSMLAERESEFKISNNVAPDLSRLFHLLHPQYAGFFRTHERSVA